MPPTRVSRLLRLIDHRVLGAPKKVYAPHEVKPRWMRTARDEVAAVRAELHQLRRRVEVLEGERAGDTQRPGDGVRTPGSVQGR